MTALLYRLRQVPEDEAEDIRQLLRDHGMDFYETHAGNWGISMPAIWLTDDTDLSTARRLLAEYQQQRAQREREARKERRRDGLEPGLRDTLRQRPWLFIGTVLFCLFIIYVMVKPFIELAKSP